MQTGEFLKSESAPQEHLANELSTMVVGAIIRLTHKADPFVYKNTKRSSLEHRIAHIRCCERCHTILASVRPNIEALFELLADKVRR